MSGWMFVGAVIFCWGAVFGAAVVWWGYIGRQK